MKLAYRPLQKALPLGENAPLVLVIENPVFYRETIAMLLSQLEGCEGDFFLSENNKEIKLSRSAAVVLQPFQLELNQRKVLGKLYEQLSQLAAGPGLIGETQAMKSYLARYLLRLTTESVEQLDFNLDFNVKDILTATNVRFSDEGGVLERLAAYARLCRGFLGFPLLIVVGLASYFTGEELKAFYKELEYEKIRLLQIERFCPVKVAQELFYVIDDDLCEVRCDFDPELL